MKNILIVEDDPFCIEFYSLILRRAGFTPCLTDSIDNIENLLLEKEYALIIMDINLKKASMNGQRVDGLMITKNLKNDDRFMHIPVVLVTAYSRASIKNDVIDETKANAIITKPISDINQFISKLESVML